MTGAGAALVLGLACGLAPIAAAPPAHADLFDLDWLGDILGSGVDAVDPSTGLDSLGDVSGSLAATDFSALLDQLISQPLQNDFDAWTSSPFGVQVDDAINSLFGQDVISSSHDSVVGSWLFGGDDAPSTADTSGSSSVDIAPDHATVPLTMNGTTQPVTDISVGGGKDIPVVVDTGSNGLVMPWWDLGSANLGFPTDFGFGSYAGGMGYFYVQMPETVDFLGSNGEIITGTTSAVPVDVVLFSFPTSLNTLFTAWSLPTFLGPSDADGVLGIAPDAAGPNPAGTETVIQALPGEQSQGVLFDEPGKQLVFGAPPTDLGQGTTVDGVANAKLWVSIGDQAPVEMPTIIDSGGVYGTIPATGATVGAPLPDGTVINVYAHQGDTDPLYSVTAGENGPGPTVISPGTTGSPAHMNTGYYPFNDGPVYISYAPNGAQTIFYP